MPLYLFKCASCGERFEKLAPLTQRERAVCPKCGGEAERAYEGACAFGGKRGEGASVSASGGCSGKSCAGCSGCSGHRA